MNGNYRVQGFFFALGAYTLWGLLPLYFAALSAVNPFEVVAWRILLALVFCAAALSLIRGWRPLLELLRERRIVGWMLVAAALIWVNWQVFIYATSQQRVLESALGYFINPLVTVFLGVLVLRERLRPLQWVAVAIGMCAVVALAVESGGLPWVSLALAFSFGFYGLVKARIRNRVSALAGLSLETAFLVPVAVLQLVLAGASSGLAGLTGPAWRIALVLGVGVATAIPLLLFAAGSRRLELVTIGLMQFAAPILQFLVGYFLLGEPMVPARWIGFGLVWVALAVLSADLIRRFGSGSRTRG